MSNATDRPPRSATAAPFSRQPGAPRTTVCAKHGLRHDPLALCVLCKKEEPRGSLLLAVRVVLALLVAVLCFYGWLYLF